MQNHRSPLKPRNRVYQMPRKQQAVLEFIHDRGASGATDKQIQSGLAMSRCEQRPRRRELQQAGLIREANHTRKGRKVWIVVDSETTQQKLTPRMLAARVYAYGRQIVPDEAKFLSAYAVVSENLLWYEVRAWAANSTSWTIDYGTWPEQEELYFTDATCEHSFDGSYFGMAYPAGQHYCMGAIEDLFNALFEREFHRADGSAMRLDIAGIDANCFTDTVRKAIKRVGRVGRSGKLWPVHARSFRPPKTSINDLKEREGDVIGDHWRRRSPETGGLRYIMYDSDHWKSHHRNRLMMPADDPGSLTWFKCSDHRMISEHHCVEYAETFGNDATDKAFEVWSTRPGRESFLWEVGVGNDVLGNVLGCRISA